MALITAAEIIDKAFTNANMDTHLIKDTFIEIAELNYIKPFLGDTLYDACVLGGNVTLVNDYLKDYLAFCVKFEVLPDITYNTTSQGVVENLADFTSPVSKDKLNFLRGETYKKAETFKKKARVYLQENCDLYPTWVDDTAGGVSKKFGIITY